MNINEIIEIILGSVVVILGYFLKVIHTDVRKNTERVGENRGKIDNLSTRIEHEAEMRNQTHGAIMDILNEIKADLKELKK